MWILAVACVAILITMSFALVRAMLGPTVFDRVLSLNVFGTKTVLLICVVSFLQGRTDFLDLALLYSLMNFIGVVALLRFTTTGDFSDAPEIIGPLGVLPENHSAAATMASGVSTTRDSVSQDSVSQDSVSQDSVSQGSAKPGSGGPGKDAGQGV